MSRCPPARILLPLLLLAGIVGQAYGEFYLPRLISNSGITQVTHPQPVVKNNILKYFEQGSHSEAVQGDKQVAFTWGIGGPRVGRPSNSKPYPAAPAEGIAGNVTDLAASGHTAVVANGVLFTCGRNDSGGGGGHGSPPIPDSGQLGRAGAMNIFLPVRGPLEGQTVLSAACGRYHTLALTEDGKVYSFGLNDYGQLGRSGLVGLKSKSGCICDSGGSCQCSEGAEYNLQPGDECPGGPSCRSGVPGHVVLPGRAVQVAAGRYSSFALTDQGVIWTWGLNGCWGDQHEQKHEGQSPHVLLKDPKLAASPRRVGESIRKAFVVQLSVGYTGVTAVDLTGQVHNCLTGFDGYAGVAEPGAAGFKPENLARQPIHDKMPFFMNRLTFDHPVVAVANGRCHTAMVTKEGHLYTFGCGALGREGLGSEIKRVEGPLLTETVVGVTAGEWFTLAVTKSGKVFGWGDAASGQMGQKMERTDNHPVEVPLQGPGGEQVHAYKVAAGYQHALATALLIN